MSIVGGRDDGFGVNPLVSSNVRRDQAFIDSIRAEWGELDDGIGETAAVLRAERSGAGDAPDRGSGSIRYGC